MKFYSIMAILLVVVGTAIYELGTHIEKDEADRKLRRDKWMAECTVVHDRFGCDYLCAQSSCGSDK